MKLTNKFDLPSVFERFESQHVHSTEGAKYSITKLIDSPKIARLRKIHQEDSEEDISNRIWAILGTAVHNILEMGADGNHVVEERLHGLINNVSISGQIDLQTIHPDGTITISDYKTIRAFSLQANPEGKEDWIRQINGYSALASLNDLNVRAVEVIAIVRDWFPGGVERFDDYPVAPVVRVPLPLWSTEKSIQYLEERVAAHESEETSDCTFEEMWAKAAVYAVHEQTKNGTLRKRATRLFDSRTDAEIFSLDLNKAQVIERPRTFSRCEGNYCNVAEHCDQYRRILDGNA